MKRKRNEYQIQITNDGELPSKDAKEGGGLSALRKAVEAEGGSMNTFSNLLLSVAEFTSV